MPERQRMTTRLKTLFQRPALFVLAGVINPIGAKMAEALGYDAFYMSGGNTSAPQPGWPGSGTSMRDMVDNARKIVLTVQIPVFADADTGYGDAISTHYNSIRSPARRTRRAAALPRGNGERWTRRSRHTSPNPCLGSGWPSWCGSARGTSHGRSSNPS